MWNVRKGKVGLKRVYIWGAGYYADYIYSVIDKKSCIINGMIDEDEDKQGKCWKDKLRIYSPEELEKLDFEYIVISILKYNEVENKCKELHIPETKIISYWKDVESNGLFENRAERIRKEQKENIILKNRLDSAPYEWGLKPVPIIYSAVELLNKIIDEKSSLCRFGDGEFNMMREVDRPWFQKKSKSLKNRLIEIINTNIPDINIAIAQNYIGLERYKEADADSIREYMSYDTRDDIFKFIDLKRVYYDAYVSRPYIMYKDKTNAVQIFYLFKKIWRGRDVIIVEGKYARGGINNDLYAEAKSIKRIICPSENAWDHYEEILKSVLRHIKKEDLVCISLGPTATVLAYDIAKLGFQALDIGQLDNEYDWYQSGVMKRTAILGKMVAEVDNNGNLLDFNNQEYVSQIVEKIG